MLLLGLISADQTLCRAVAEHLKGEAAWQLAVFTSLEEALSAWSHTLPQLLLWDATHAPISDEFAAFFFERLRQARPAPLLLVLGEPPEPIERFGVTEAFQRPLRLGYLSARLHFYERLLDQAPDSTLPLGPWLFAPRARSLTPKEGGEGLKLTDKESSLLAFLYAAQELVPREELLAAIWGYDARIDTHTLETHIYRLRRKLMTLQPEGEDVFLAQEGGYQISSSWRSA